MVGDFIRLYTTRTNCWLSPKFLIGESYGTTRAAGLSGYLQERHGMYLNGIMLISAVLDFTTLDFNINNDLPYILFLPGYTATAWYHHVLLPHKPLQTWLKEAEEFALGDYARALLKGDSLSREERELIIEQVSMYTGVSKQFVERSKLRIDAFQYFKELLRERGLTVGRLDSRFTGKDRLGVTEHAEYDPLLTNVQGPYTAGFNDYVRSELKFEFDLSYEILSGFVHPWSYAEFENKYVDVSENFPQGDEHQSVSQGLHCKRILRSRYTVFCDRIHVRPSRPGRGTAPEYFDGILRSWAHDVHPSAVVETAEEGSVGFHQERDVRFHGDQKRSGHFCLLLFLVSLAWDGSLSNLMHHGCSVL